MKIEEQKLQNNSQQQNYNPNGESRLSQGALQGLKNHNNQVQPKQQPKDLKQNSKKDLSKLQDIIKEEEKKKEKEIKVPDYFKNLYTNEDFETLNQVNESTKENNQFKKPSGPVLSFVKNLVNTVGNLISTISGNPPAPEFDPEKETEKDYIKGQQKDWAKNLDDKLKEGGNMASQKVKGEYQQYQQTNQQNKEINETNKQLNSQHFQMEQQRLSQEEQQNQQNQKQADQSPLIPKNFFNPDNKGQLTDGEYILRAIEEIKKWLKQQEENSYGKQLVEGNYTNEELEEKKAAQLAKDKQKNINDIAISNNDSKVKEIWKKYLEYKNANEDEKVSELSTKINTNGIDEITKKIATLSEQAYEYNELSNKGNNVQEREDNKSKAKEKFKDNLSNIENYIAEKIGDEKNQDKIKKVLSDSKEYYNEAKKYIQSLNSTTPVQKLGALKKYLPECYQTIKDQQEGKFIPNEIKNLKSNNQENPMEKKPNQAQNNKEDEKQNNGQDSKQSSEENLNQQKASQNNNQVQKENNLKIQQLDPNINKKNNSISSYNSNKIPEDSKFKKFISKDDFNLSNIQQKSNIAPPLPNRKFASKEI